MSHDLARVSAATRISAATRLGAAVLVALGATTVLAMPAEAATVAAAPSCPAGGARAAADAYLASLTSHHADAVPFAPDVTRVENGLNTGSSADEIRNDLNTSPKYWIITELTDKTYSESSPRPGTTTVNVVYRLGIGLNGFTVFSVKVTERFDVTCGRIGYIKADIGL